MDETRITRPEPHRSAYGMFFNADGSWKSIEQYLAETEPES